MSKTFLGGLTNRVLMTIAAGGLVLSYLAIFINPAKAWFMMIAGLMFFPLALLNFGLFIWAIFRRSRALLIPMIALVPTIFFLNRYFKFSSDDGESIDGTVRVVSYNVGRFRMGEDGVGGRDRCADSIYTFLREEDADIICLQEYSSLNSESCSEDLSARFPGYEIEYYMFPSGSEHFGNVILSRLPIVGKGVLRFENSANLAVYADVRTDGRNIRVYNCHFESYNISFPGIVKSMLEKERDVLRRTEEKVKRSLSMRPRQVDKVLQHISSCSSPTVLCGDFNDNPMSYTYQRLIKGHQDTFCKAGGGFGATYSVLWPMLRIDYILVPDECEVASHRTERMRASDHYPVRADLRI